MKKRFSVNYIYLVLLLSIPILFFILLPKYFSSQTPIAQKTPTHIPTSTITPTPFVFKSYTTPVIEKKPVYKIVMIGDSMTAALGPHGGGLSEYMNSIYKKDAHDPQRIIIDNYAKSSNILSV